MDKKTLEKPEGIGKLPRFAPLANPYVPFQPEHSGQYDARKALIRGTLYPGLDLPFMGMVNKKLLPSTPQSEMQVLAFAIQELTLYLDTHRDDREALELLKKYQVVYHKAKTEYEKSRGPVTSRSYTDTGEYEWVRDPWPWEYCANKEV